METKTKRTNRTRASRTILGTKPILTGKNPSQSGRERYKPQDPTSKKPGQDSAHNRPDRGDG